MALSLVCQKCGTSYVSADIYKDWPEGAPYCPKCFEEWCKENNVEFPFESYKDHPMYLGEKNDDKEMADWYEEYIEQIAKENLRKMKLNQFTFHEYQIMAWSTGKYPGMGNNWVYPVLGLGGESGEVLEKFKKLIRDDNGVITQERLELIKKELGDVLWYVAAICSELKIEMSDVAMSNNEKLLDRLERGKIKGDGDNR